MIENTVKKKTNSKAVVSRQFIEELTQWSLIYKKKTLNTRPQRNANFKVYFCSYKIDVGLSGTAWGT